MNLIRRLGLALAMALALPVLAFAAPTFPVLSGRVVDQANLLSPAAEQRLTGELAALEAKTGHQLVVATVPDLQGYEIADYGYQLGRAWALGRKGVNDGAILLVAPGERKVRVEVGYGLEPVLTDALSSLIIQRKVLPAFRDGDMEKGVVDGTEALVAQLGLPPEEARANAQAALTVQAPATGGGDFGPGLIVAIVVVFLALSVVMRLLGGRRAGGGLWWLLWAILSSGGGGRRGGGWSSGGWSGGGGGGFSGGGGSFGGGGASGSW